MGRTKLRIKEGRRYTGVYAWDIWAWVETEAKRKRESISTVLNRLCAEAIAARKMVAQLEGRVESREKTAEHEY